uniref:Nuclear pore complex NUP2/50/61 domain-containing protein n=1 Tax=Aegilops tauschii subsp. strangulata TaxID=200361 RepID=A0A453DFZ3_AEGTS
HRSLALSATTPSPLRFPAPRPSRAGAGAVPVRPRQDAPRSGPQPSPTSELSRKRVMDVHRAESPHTGAAALDPRRAEAANRHVRALNAQFASWVQSQLQNHPAELWEDGVKDYLSHASEIMNKAGTTAVSSPSPANEEKTTTPATVNSKFMVQPGSDNGQKSPTTGASSLAFQNSSSPNMFSLPSQKKTTPFGGIFDNKDTPGDSSKSTFQFGGNNGFSTPTNTPLAIAANRLSSLVEITAFQHQLLRPFFLPLVPVLTCQPQHCFQ